MEKNEVRRRLYGAVLLAAVMAYLAGWLIFGLTALLPEPMIPAGDFHPAIVAQMRPEPRENLTFLLLCLLAPLLVWGAIRLVHRLPETYLPGSWVLWSFPVLVLWCVWGSEYAGIFFDPMLKFSLVAAVMAGIGLRLFYRRRNRRWEYRVSLALIILLPILQVFAFRLYTTWNLHLLFTHHLDIIAYAVSQAAAGGSDFHQYGFYPHFLAPVFRLTGTGVLPISCLMGILYLAGFILLFRAVLPLARAPFVLGAALLLFIGSSWASLNDDLFDPYFAYYPIRFVFPALGTALLLYCEKRRQRYPRSSWFYGVFSALAFAWNPDSGVAVTGAFFFLELLELFREKREWQRPLEFAGGWLGAALLLGAVIAWKAGSIEVLRQMFFGNQYFYRYGFFMLPMPKLPALWGMVVLIYLSSLTYGLWALSRRQESRFSRLSLFLAVLGLGLFLYYQGRSHDFNLIPVSWPAILLFFLFAGRLTRGRGSDRGEWALPYFALFLMLMGAGTVLLQGQRIGQGIGNACKGIAAAGENSPIAENTRFILEAAGDRAEVNIYGYNQGIFYAESGLRAGISNFGELEPDDNHGFDRIRRALLETNAPLFLSMGPEEDLWLLEPVLPFYRVIARSPNRTMIYLERLAGGTDGSGSSVEPEPDKH